MSEAGNATFNGSIIAPSLDISGDVDVDGTLEADAITVNGTALATVIAGTTVNNATLASTVTVSDSTANTNFPVVFHDESNGLLDDTGALRYNPSTGELLVPNLTVAGTTTTVDTVTMNAQNAIVFEGATADANETTLTIVDPTADRTINLPNQSGTIPVLAAVSTTQITSTPEELNILDGVTSTTAELNILDGVTATTTELNYLDITTLGTVEASKAVTADANGDVTFPDNEKAIFGTGSDLEILHDGSHSIIRENNDNRIFIQSNNTTDGVLITKKLGTETMAKFIADGGVELNYNNSKKFETTSTGVDIAGDITAKTSDGAILKLQTSDTIVTDGDVLGAIEFNAPDEASGTDAILTAASIVAEADGPFNEYTNRADFVFKLGSSEAATEKMRLEHEGNLTIEGGVFSLKNTGTQSEVRLYCESSNAHYAALKAPAHADFSGNITLTLPATTGTLISTANSDAPTTTTSSSDADFVLVDDGGVMKRLLLLI